MDLATSFGPETQEREVRALAQRFGDNGDRLVVKADWDVSGAGKYTRKRTGYLELVAAVESGDANAVYSYSLSRLGRSVHELSRLFDLCGDRHVPIRLVADSIDTGTASGTMVANILASVAQFESQVASERRLAQNATRVARGQSLRTRRQYGEADGENAEQVLALFRETGSYTATARRLNAEGVPARSGKQWWAASVKLVVRRLDPTIRSEGRGKAHRVSFTLARLLRCPSCDTLLTGTHVRRGAARYACSNYTDGPHPRTSVSERLVLPWIRERVDALRVPTDMIEVEQQNTAKREAIIARRDRFVEMYADGSVSRERYQIEMANAADDLEGLDTATAVIDLPSIDWGWPPADVNRLLRLLIDHVILGPDLRPVDIDWRGDIAEWAR